MAGKNLSENEVLHIAKLCNLPLSKTETERLSSMLTQAIEYIDVLNELDTSKTEETYQVTGLLNVFQNDNDTSTTLSQSESLSNAKKEIKKQFATKAIFDRS